MGSEVLIVRGKILCFHLLELGAHLHEDEFWRYPVINKLNIKAPIPIIRLEKNKPKFEMPHYSGHFPSSVPMRSDFRIVTFPRNIFLPKSGFHEGGRSLITI